MNENTATSEPNESIEKDETNRKKMVSVECPFKAFQVISQHAELDFIKKLGKLLTNVAEVMDS